MKFISSAFAFVIRKSPQWKTPSADVCVHQKQTVCLWPKLQDYCKDKVARAQTRDSAHSTQWSWLSWSGVVLWNCGSSSWTDDYPYEQQGEEPQAGLSCLSKNSNISTHKAMLQNHKQYCGCMWCDGGNIIFFFLNTEFIYRKEVVTHLFKVMLLRASSCRRETASVLVWCLQWEKHRCRSGCLLTVIMWCDLNSSWRYFWILVKSQSQHNITSMWLFNSSWRHFWILVVSLSQTSFHTHSTVGETPPASY